MRVSCSQIQSWMTDYLAGELPGEETALVRTHVRDCPACQAELDGLGVTFIYLRGRFQALKRDWAQYIERAPVEKETRETAVYAPLVLRRVVRVAGLGAAACLVATVSLVLIDRGPETPRGGDGPAGVVVRSGLGEPVGGELRQAHYYYGLGNDPTVPVQTGVVDSGFREASHRARDDQWDDNSVTYVTPPAYGLGWRPGLEFL